MLTRAAEAKPRVRGNWEHVVMLTCLISPDRFNLEERPWLLQLNNTAA
jgi:hypothetical protein